MRAGDLLRRLDSILLPPLARGMARLGQGPVRSRVLTGAALLSATAVLVTAVWAADRRQAGDPTVGEVVRVGVVEGDSIPSYVSASRHELARMLAEPPVDTPSGETYALVTFSAYLAPDRLTPVLDGVSVSEVFTRVPLPETQTQIVRIPAFRIPTDVVAGMGLVAGRKDREAADYQQRADAVAGDGEPERELRAVYDSGVRVASAEATAYRSKCSCVYAAVVRATPAGLDRIAARTEVRAVDPAPEVRRLDRAVFLPPLPEQDDIVRPPVDQGLADPADGATPSASGVPGAVQTPSAGGARPSDETSPAGVPSVTPGATESGRGDPEAPASTGLTPSDGQ
ncbi:hypothetical protein [Polymorphospora rubra]|uniref:Uncharacterized protein n=1 Tax=Polymorphospora rubra TaxID=338584 RepID=A0A810MTI9_9ACTN|nr:hypothetical protein [Polymorphospora rubra]BCJ63349.1 hypothetical protein Prubr_03700 [Polymorphospora rubra]